MFKVKKNAPTLGDNHEAGTIFPVDMPIHSKEYVAYLKKEHPEQYEEMLRLRKLLLNATEATNLSDLYGQSNNEDLIKRTRENVMILFEDFGAKGDFESEKKRIGGYGDRVNKMLEKTIDEMFPAYAGMLGIREEAKTNDVGKLLLTTLDPTEDVQARYEAKRKFELMRLLTKIDDEFRKRGDTHDFFWGLMKSRICSKEGRLKRKWMISRHDLNNNNLCTECELADEPPASLDENQVVEPMDSRSMEVMNPDGTSRTIRFMYDSREKDAESILLKWLRKPNRSFEELMSDAYGARMIFENAEDLKAFKYTLMYRLTSPDQNMGRAYNVEEQKQKNGVGKNGSSEPAISCDKFNLAIDRKDVELQMFTKEQFADYQTHRPNSWVEYKVKRFFEHSLSETLFPDSIYPNMPRQQISEQATDMAYRDFWEERKMFPKLATETRGAVKKVALSEKPVSTGRIIIEGDMN